MITEADKQEARRNGEHAVSHSDPSVAWRNLTKRELFAAMLMQGMVSNHSVTESAHERLDTPEQRAEEIAGAAVRGADALLLALETVKP